MNWMTVQDVAKYLKLSTMMIYKLAQENRIPAVKIGRVWRFDKDAIDEWLKGKKTEGANIADKVVADFSLRLQRLLGFNLVRVIIFGSRARGDAVEGSDIDVMVVVRSIGNYGKLRFQIGEAAYEATFEKGAAIVLSPVIVDEKEYLTGLSPLMINVRKEGKIAA